jgi:nicotinamide mononucleotide transporter
MLNFFSVDTIFLMIGDYPLSYIELIGTLAYFASVGLIAKKNMLTWPVGILSVILYGILFYQIRLYSDTLEQIYYLVISVYGWITWEQSKAQKKEITNNFSSPKEMAIWFGITMGAAVVLAFLTSNFHIWIPSLFPEPASFPFLDALTTVMSFVAMYLLTKRKTESWIYWIIVDVIAIGLYWVKDVRFISVQYIALLCMAFYGLLNWMRQNQKTAVE